MLLLLLLRAPPLGSAGRPVCGMEGCVGGGRGVVGWESRSVESEICR